MNFNTINQAKMYREIISAYFENQKKPLQIYEKNAEISKGKGVDVHCVEMLRQREILDSVRTEVLYIQADE